MERDTVTELLQDATNRLVRAVDGMPDEAWTEPSQLPGWSRSHVVAHLTRNAECLALALAGVRDGVAVPMYESQEARDRDIEELSGATPSVLRNRLLGSTTDLRRAWEDLDVEQLSVQIERTPGGASFAAGYVGDMRVREVEIHLVDLDLGATRASWSPEFAELLLDSMAVVSATVPGCDVEPDDLDGSWQVSGGGEAVHGSAVDLGWWLTGRGAGEGLRGDGTIPMVEH